MNKFRVYDTEKKQYFKPIHEFYKGELEDLFLGKNGELYMHTTHDSKISTKIVHQSCFENRFIVEHWTGLVTKRDLIEIYEGDICITSISTQPIGIVKFGVFDHDDGEYYPKAHGFYLDCGSYDGERSIFELLDWDIKIVGNVNENDMLELKLKYE